VPCELPRIPQQAITRQSTKSKKAKHKLKQPKPATVTIPVRVEFVGCRTGTYPGQGSRFLNLGPTTADQHYLPLELGYTTVASSCLTGI
jgi:hypothetical protein